MIEFPKDFKEFLQLMNSKDDLLINKRSSGRPQDLVDFDKLQKK